MPRFARYATYVFSYYFTIAELSLGESNSVCCAFKKLLKLKTDREARDS